MTTHINSLKIVGIIATWQVFAVKLQIIKQNTQLTKKTTVFFYKKTIIIKQLTSRKIKKSISIPPFQFGTFFALTQGLSNKFT
jgi:hypothetical protein